MAEKDTTQINIKNIPVELLGKLKSIAVMEDVPSTKVYILAFEKFVELYEKKNGKVKSLPKGKGLEGL